MKYFKLLMIIVIGLFSSCGTDECEPTIEEVIIETTDTIYVPLDTVFLDGTDTIFLDNGDTVYINVTDTVFQTNYDTIIETVYDTIYVPTNGEIPYIGEWDMHTLTVYEDDGTFFATQPWSWNINIRYQYYLIDSDQNGIYESEYVCEHFMQDGNMNVDFGNMEILYEVVLSGGDLELIETRTNGWTYHYYCTRL